MIYDQVVADHGIDPVRDLQRRVIKHANRARAMQIETMTQVLRSYSGTCKRVVRYFERFNNQILIATKAAAYERRGWDQAAEVIRTREGQRIVREGMRDVLVWLGEDKE